MNSQSSVFTFVLCCIGSVVHGFIGGVAHKDPRPKGSMERQPRFLAIGRPNIDLGSCPEVDVVQDFRKDEYLGDWYAAYANPTWFQTEETSCSRARYTPNDDGSIGVFNSGEDQSGRYTEICGFATQPMPEMNKGALSVNFGYGDGDGANYLLLGTDYTSYATVYSCKDLLLARSQSAWILTRERQPSDDTIKKAMDAFERNDVDIASLNLFKMRQDDDCTNDLSPSCADDESNLMPSDDGVLERFTNIFGFKDFKIGR